jgi:hypothetical protein
LRNDYKATASATLAILALSSALLRSQFLFFQLYSFHCYNLLSFLLCIQLSSPFYSIYSTGGWIAEFVRCVTGDVILKDWAKELNRRSKGERKKKGKGAIFVTLFSIPCHPTPFNTLNLRGLARDILLYFFSPSTTHNSTSFL